MIKSINKFLTILDITEDEYKDIVLNLDQYYYEQRIPKLSRRGNIQYLEGKVKERVLCPSTGKLKAIQSKINRMLNQNISFPSYYFGGIKRKDNIRNAKAHQGSHFFFLSDIKNFYPSIKSKRVYDTLVHLGYSADVSHRITKLCTYKGSLPQGIPTATTIANLTTLALSNDLKDLCIKHFIRFTIFIDDLTFSSQADFSGLAEDFVSIIQSFGFNISYRKTDYKIGKATVTGVVVRQNSITPPSYIIDKYKRANNPEEKSKLLNYLNRFSIDIAKLNRLTKH